MLSLSTSLQALLVAGAFYKELMLYSFDPVQARVLGIPTGFLHYTLMVLTAAAVVASLSTVGIVLVIALLIRALLVSPRRGILAQKVRAARGASSSEGDDAGA